MLKHSCTCNDYHCTRKNNPISTVHWPTNQSSPERPVPKYGDFRGARRRDGSMANPTTRRIWTCAGGLALAARKASGASTACKATDKLTTTAWGGRKGREKKERNKERNKEKTGSVKSKRSRRVPSGAAVAPRAMCAAKRRRRRWRRAGRNLCSSYRRPTPLSSTRSLPVNTNGNRPWSGAEPDNLYHRATGLVEQHGNGPMQALDECYTSGRFGRAGRPAGVGW